MFTIQQFFKFGLDRDIPDLLDPEGYTVELGPGKKEKITTDIKLGAGEPIGYRLGWKVTRAKNPWRDEFELTGPSPARIRWVAPHVMPIPEGAIGQIWAAQFFEHLTGDDAVLTLRECERVLRPGGVLNMVVPYYNSAHMAQALDHRSFWNEETWHWLFNNEYYDDHQGKGWRLQVHTCFLMGVVERNLDLFTQLVKV